MKLDKSLSSMVYNSVISQDLSDLTNTDIVMIEVLTYHIVKNLLDNEMIQDGTILDNTEKYAKTYLTTVKTLKIKFTAYSRMKYYIEDNNINSIFDASSTDIENIVKIYEKRKEMITFNITNFNPLMYNASNLTSEYFDRLLKIHTLIMTPIFLYYKKKYNISDEDFIIEDIMGVPDNPGKIIKFRINGINSSAILAHLNMNLIGINIYLYKIYIEGNSVFIMIK